MGGIGSGRRPLPPEERRPPVADVGRYVDVRDFKKHKLIGPGQTEVSFVAQLLDEEDRPMPGKALKGEGIPVAWTPCNFGGYRPWFVCPEKEGGCGRRVAILYEPNPPLCRICRGLCYRPATPKPKKARSRRPKKVEAGRR